VHASKRAVAVGAALAIAVAAGTAYATIPDSGGVIHACYAQSGALKVIDPSASERCGKNEKALDWNARGPQGAPGPTGAAGAQGPPGPAGSPGAIGNLDALDGIPCRGVRGKFATVRVDYGSGIEAPVSLTCVTHLVANPGPFMLGISGVTLQLGFLGERPLPVTGSVAGTVDLGGHVATAGLPVTTVTFEQTQDLGGFAGVHVSGSLTLSSTSLVGNIDPEPGTAALTAGLSGSVTLDVSGTIFGVPTVLYAGTCAFGTAAAPISTTLTTDPPGVPYSSSTGEVTLTAPFTAPSLDDCAPAMPSAYAFLLDLFAGSGRLTLSGTTTPILKPT
jgi:collagen type I alpha